MKAALHRKSPELVNRKHITFHQNNARPHVSLMTKQKLLYLGLEAPIHLLYSPDIVPSNFHLFWSLQNSLNGKNFNSPGIKGTLNSSLLKKIKSFGKKEL